MPFASQISPINSNQNLFVESSVKTLGLDQQNKSLPKWLVEFDGFSTTDDRQQSENKQPRPLTESHIQNRPKWFEELSQKRRMSDISNINYAERSALVYQNHNSIDHKNIKIQTSIVEIKEEISDTSTNMTQRDIKTPSDYLLSLEDNSFKTSDSRKSSSNDSKCSFNLNELMSDEEIFTFSTTKSIENLKLDDILNHYDDECVIPEMPNGNELSLMLMNNWGDEHYIGINGIEILDQHGNRPNFKNIYIEDQGNNRLQITDLQKLVDNVYRTHDDSHIWQFRAHKNQLPLRIVFQLDRAISIALIRIWNYNKSRIYSYRGVKFVKIKLNGQLIFSGEIAKASGNLTGSVENFGDTILFTTDENILEQISQHDLSFQELLMEQI